MYIYIYIVIHVYFTSREVFRLVIGEDMVKGLMVIVDVVMMVDMLIVIYSNTGIHDTKLANRITDYK